MDVRGCLATYAACTARAGDLLAIIPGEVSSRVMLAWERGGLLVPAWHENEELSRSWISVIAHQCAVGLLAYRLGRRMERLIRDEGFSLEEVIEAALVHDSFKRCEVEYVERATQRGCDVIIATTEAENENERFLERIGFSSEVVRLTGSTGLKGWELIRGSENGASVAEKVIFYADCCVSNDKIVGHRQRFDDLKPYFDPGGRYAGVDESLLAKYGETHGELWSEVLFPLERELASLAGFPGKPEELHTV